jgi:hypothetical protein
MRNTEIAEEDAYIKHISSSSNVLLIRKIALWWRRIQIENSCVLTANILKQAGCFEMQLSAFFRDAKYSPFREEVYMQFLAYVITKEISPLIQSVAEFEMALIRLKLGEEIETSVLWHCDPYQVITGLMNNNLDTETLTEEKYYTLISYKHKKDLFSVVPVP